MHELSVTRDMLDLVLEHAREVRASRVVTIRVVMGGLTGIVEDSLRFCFAILGDGTVAQGAELDVQVLPARVQCRVCLAESNLTEYQWICPECHAAQLSIIQGSELFLDSMEVE